MYTSLKQNDISHAKLAIIIETKKRNGKKLLIVH